MRMYDAPVITIGISISAIQLTHGFMEMWCPPRRRRGAASGRAASGRAASGRAASGRVVTGRVVTGCMRRVLFAPVQLFSDEPYSIWRTTVIRGGLSLVR
jgi:hypothetical protein